MKRVNLLLSTGMLFAFLLASCGGGQVQGVGSSSATEAGAAAESSTYSIDLSGPPPGTPMVWVDGSILVHVPGGEFIMGGEGADNPVHQLALSSFWIYRTKVTNRMYTHCVAVGECTPPADEKSLKEFNDPASRDLPVSGVNWEQAAAYCRFVEGRLPTEAEWEKTARGPEGNVYPWGNGQPECTRLNFNGDCVGRKSKVFDYPAGKSYYSALDMEGNAFEWTADWYDPNYYGSSPVADPIGPEAGTVRSVRGTSYQSDPGQTPAYRRFFLDPKVVRPDLGFRCVVEEPHPFPPMCAQIFIPGKLGEEPLGGQLIDYSDCDVPSVTVDELKCDQPHADPQIASISGHAVVGSIDSVSGGSMSCTNIDAKFSCVGPDDQTVSGMVCIDCENAKYPAGGECGIGSYYDEDTDSCVSEGQPAECPRGYAYDSVNQCCTAGPGIPAIGCGPDEALVDGQCVPGSSETNSSCKSFSFPVSECTVPPTKTPPPPVVRCQNPARYTSPDTCRAAGCTWVQDNRHPYGICQ